MEIGRLPWALCEFVARSAGRAPVWPLATSNTISPQRWSVCTGLITGASKRFLDRSTKNYHYSCFRKEHFTQILSILPRFSFPRSTRKSANLEEGRKKKENYLKPFVRIILISFLWLRIGSFTSIKRFQRCSTIRIKYFPIRYRFKLFVYNILYIYF